MSHRQCVTEYRRSFSVPAGVFVVLILTIAIYGLSFAQPAPASPERAAPAEAKPFAIERRVVDGNKLDPRARFELLPAAGGKTCAPWRFEAWSLSNGRAVVDLKEPADKKVILDADVAPDHLELVLGDSDCSYRVRIERNK